MMEWLNTAILGAILVAIISTAAGLLSRVRDLEQAMYNGIAARQDRVEEKVDWLIQDTLSQARTASRSVPTLPDSIDTSEMPEVQP